MVGIIKGLLNDMIDKLEAEEEAKASENAYCVKELGESKANKKVLWTAVDKLSTKIDQQTAKAAKLKEEVVVLEKELAELATAQAKMGQLREEEKALFKTKETETSKGPALSSRTVNMQQLFDHCINPLTGHIKDMSDQIALFGKAATLSAKEIAECDLRIRTLEAQVASSNNV